MIVSLNTLAVISENHTLPIEMEGKFLGLRLAEVQSAMGQQKDGETQPF